MSSDRIQPTHLGSLCFQFCPVLDFPFPHPRQSHVCTVVHFAARTSSLGSKPAPVCCRMREGPPKLGGTWHHPGVTPPWLWSPAQGAGICRTTPCSHPWPHSTHCAFPMKDTHRKVMLWLSGVSPDTTTTAHLEVPTGVALAIGSTRLLGWWQGAGFGSVLWCHYFDNDFCLTDIPPPPLLGANLTQNQNLSRSALKCKIISASQKDPFHEHLIDHKICSHSILQKHPLQ